MKVIIIFDWKIKLVFRFEWENLRNLIKKDDSLILLQIIPGFFEYDDSDRAFDISIPLLKAISLKV